MEKFDADEIIEEFESMTKDAKRIQSEILKKILEENGNTEYLKKWGLGGRTDPDTFKLCVPVVTYSDLEPYFQRIVDGDLNPILTENPITAISFSSGTSHGKLKLFPFTNQIREHYIQTAKTSFAYRSREFSTVKGKALNFFYNSKQHTTKGGLIAASATTNIFRGSLYKNTMSAIQLPSCSPDEVVEGPEFNQSTYCHILCGLIYRNEVVVIMSSFAYTIVLAFQTFERVWKELCRDIRDGVLSSKINVQPMRIAMSKLLKPNPELADTIYKKCMGLNNWYGLIPELFPSVKYINGTTTGSMAHYVKKLRHYAGDLPLFSGNYAATEGIIGTNIDLKLPPQLATYVIFPNFGYFEFLPVTNNVTAMKAKPVSFTEVKIGEEYEIIITNFSGFYRYNLGDVVKVTGFHNNTPELQFICRKNVILSVNMDKTTEEELQLAVDAASSQLAKEKLQVVDFTSQVDRSTEPGHYVIFLEVSGKPCDKILQECCDCLDRSFANTAYVRSRQIHATGALELRVVSIGTFLKVLDHYVGLGCAPSQFKTPRFIGCENVILMEILGSNIFKSYFSNAYN